VPNLILLVFNFSLCGLGLWNSGLGLATCYESVHCAIISLQYAGGLDSAGGGSRSAIGQFLRELCDSSAVKRPVTLLARRYRTVIGRDGRKFRDISSFRLTGNSETLVTPIAGSGLNVLVVQQFGVGLVIERSLV